MNTKIDSNYHIKIQFKAFVLSICLLSSLYVIDNLYTDNPIFRNFEDYLQFFNPFYGFVLVFLIDDFRNFFSQMFRPLAVLMSVVYLIKYLVNAKRPSSAGGYSFPSGHTALAVASSIFIHKRYHFYYAIPAYLNSLAIGFLRVYHQKHVIRDVVGAFIIASIMVWKMVQKRTNNKISDDKICKNLLP